MRYVGSGFGATLLFAKIRSFFANAAVCYVKICKTLPFLPIIC